MKKFNWITVLNKAVRTTPSFEEWSELRSRAGDWPTCACGQLCKRLRRYEDGQPADNKLAILGFKFYKEIEGRNWRDALAIFKQIEKRSTALLIKQLYKTK